MLYHIIYQSSGRNLYMGDTKNPALSIKQLRFSYSKDPLLQINSFQLQPRERVAVIGPSGCGKTTLMHIISGLVKPQQGQIELQRTKLAGLKEWQMDRLRGREIGIVFQRLHLIPAISILNNLLITQKLSRNTQDKNSALALLERLGIADFAHKHPSQLSQGQAQRAAIARAVVHKPTLVIGDEPTSALDNQNAGAAIELLRDLSDDYGFALLVVTHDVRVRDRMDRVLDLGETS